MSPSDPAEIAENDVRSALHLPGAVRGWPRPRNVTLPAATAERVKWLDDYATALKRFAAQLGDAGDCR